MKQNGIYYVIAVIVQSGEKTRLATVQTKSNLSLELLRIFGRDIINRSIFYAVEMHITIRILKS